MISQLSLLRRGQADLMPVPCAEQGYTRVADLWAAGVALGVGLTSFALPVWCHWRVERPRGDPRQLCKSLRFVLVEIVAPAVVLFLGVALSVLPAAGLVARTAVGVVPREQSRLVER